MKQTNVVALKLPARNSGEGDVPHLYETIANDLLTKGYSVNIGGLPPDLTHALWTQVQQLSRREFAPAGIGREQDHMVNNFVRSDEICWITGESETGASWLEWATQLQAYLNRRLLLGLFSFESHYAHYAQGDFYKKHLDAFKGEANRTLSLVAYLNPGWQPDDGGELVLYTGEDDQTLRVTPGFGTVVAFLSEEFPHEVLPAQRDRYSIAGWFRVNQSSSARVDPPA
ncbi:2OG-Fe(II) oxygenase [Marinobacter zhejiangensis]|uniref:SM-20-related protein n=1 Tax=Marinobacter zhejiangensis TaxID=488535 RepID=A0A1I4KX04_9GAMM|nr:2OG-Fe(II) oxygenase [Marinobacter zhejiangensis]SFL83133.1 SM-20-related protein [Marinobacter zhejiangensis]